MCERDKNIFCPVCKQMTTHLVSGSGRLWQCGECRTEWLVVAGKRYRVEDGAKPDRV